MIEREIIKDKFLEFKVSDFIRKRLGDVPIKEISLEKTPIGDRIVIFTSAPGLVIGREGANVKKLTLKLKEEFGFENPQIKIGEVKNPFLSASIVARKIANDLARFGSQKFKLTGFRTITNIMNAGAMGVEIRLSGKLPSARSKSWRFVKGYIKKTGYVSDFLIDKAVDSVTLKSGVVGIKVSIMLPDTPLPDKIVFYEEPILIDGESKEEEILTEENLDETLDEKKKISKSSNSSEESITKTEEITEEVNEDKKEDDPGEVEKTDDEVADKKVLKEETSVDKKADSQEVEE